MKGLITGGGLGTRMGLSTKATNKHLLPVYDVPMVMNALKYLLRAGIQDVLIVSSPGQLWHFGEVLGDGSQLEGEYGHPVRIKYQRQESSTGGIGDVIRLAEEFCTVRDVNGIVVAKDSVAVALGDNVFSDEHIFVEAVKGFKGGGMGFAKVIPEAFLFQGSDEKGWNSRFGMISRKGDMVTAISEKPAATRGVEGKLQLASEFSKNEVLVGAYIFDGTVFDRIRKLKPSPRGQYEVTEILDSYRVESKLRVTEVKGWWSDCGNPDTLLLTSILCYEKKGNSLAELYSKVEMLLKE